jgi:ADP-L-glycero-D-manno-heptose 6-epimerase
VIVVTGGAGFIGSNLIRALNLSGRDDILLIEDMSEGRKCANLSDACIADYLDKQACTGLLDRGRELGANIEAVYHLGACTDTTQWDGRMMMRENFAFSRALCEYCIARKIPFVYASSAAVYGTGRQFSEEPEYERPLNMYGYSKLVFDQYVRKRLVSAQSTVIGLRYFNVYGPREQHKGRMASVVWHFFQQLIAGEQITLFAGSHGYADGEQRRDFVYVDDVVDVTLWCAAQKSAISGIYNCGTGTAETFNTVADTVLNWHQRGRLTYTPFPLALTDAYQAYTQADLSRLRAAGYMRQFRPVADGVPEYLRWLTS